jgi:RNA polymerase sigma factor (sigma-70 family)
LEKWRIVHALVCHTIDPLTRLATAIALWREDRAAPFDEDERLFFEHAMPHLIESYGMNRIVQLERAALSGSAATFASATVDALGELQIASPEFQRLLLAEWADWRGHRLPEPIRHLVDGHDGARFVGARIAMRATRMNDVFLLQAREKEAVDALSERELGIARLCTEGMTYKEIARRLGISPSTVRSHISSIFDKLHLRKQSELAAALRDLD